MNWGGWALWGFAATVVLTTVLSASQGMGLTRMSLPYLLGTLFTDSRDRAVTYGFGLHLLNGWLFALVYVATFHSWGMATPLLGAGIGAVHAAFVLTVGLRMMPGLHPRMAGETHGPTVTRQLEPPGFLGLNYGVQTPIYILAAHLAYGAILGAFYKL